MFADRWSLAASVLDPSKRVRLILSEAELDQLYRLRHRRYVVEQGKPYPESLTGRLADELDPVSLNVGYFQQGRVAAAVRLSRLEDVGPLSYLAPLRDAVPSNSQRYAMVYSRLVAEPTDHPLVAMTSLFRAGCRLAVVHGGTKSVLSTRPDLQPIFEAFGFRSAGFDFQHPIAGHQIVMTFDLHDEGYLREINSPVLGWLQGLRREAGVLA